MGAILLQVCTNRLLEMCWPTSIESHEFEREVLLEAVRPACWLRVRTYQKRSKTATRWSGAFRGCEAMCVHTYANT